MLWGVIVSALMPAWVELQGALNNAMPMFQFIGAVILGIVVVAIGILIAAVEGLAVGIGYAITGIVMIITGFIDMWNGGFQIMAGIVFFFKDLVTGNFSQLGADLGLIWRGIINLFVGGWDMIKGVFVTVGGFLVGFVGGFVVGIIQFFQHLFDALVGHSIIPDMVNGIINWFLQLPGRAGAAIQAMITSVLNLLGGLVTSALNAGSNIVKGIADGITAGLHWISGAITNVTQFISDHLPHSPAKLGPLMDLENQGMEISNQVAKGMINGAPLISNAIGNMTKPISVGLKGVSSASSTPLQGGNQGDTYITITLDGKDITNSTMKRVQREMQSRSKK
jgi:phage-related protein